MGNTEYIEITEAELDDILGITPTTKDVVNNDEIIL